MPGSGSSMFRVTTVMLAVVLLVAAAVLSSEKERADRPRVIKLERFRKALWKVRVTVLGKSGEFVFDTGGGKTLVTDAFAAELPCKFWGRTTGYNMFGQRGDGPHTNDLPIQAGEVSLTPVSLGKIDFGTRFSGDRTPDGLLALDAFDNKAITLDQAAATLTVETPRSLPQRTMKMTELPFRMARECSGHCLSAFVGVRTPEGMTWLNMDSGAGGVSLIGKEYAGAFGLTAKEGEQQLKFQVAPGVAIDSPTLVRDLIMDGNLGQPFLSQYVTTFDFAHGRLWVARAAPLSK